MSSSTKRGWIITVILAIAVGTASYAVMISDPFGQRSRPTFGLDLTRLYEVDAKWLRFREVAQYATEFDHVVAIAADNDRIYVAGDQAVEVLSLDGRPIRRIATKRHPTSLAVREADDLGTCTLLVGCNRVVELYREDGTSVGEWQFPDWKGPISSIAVTDGGVLVADAGARVVHYLDSSGALVRTLQASTSAGGHVPFNVPSTFFDVAATGTGEAHVINPGALRVETYSMDGALQARWGEAGTAIEDFFGCCNPSHLAVLADGRIVTSEKGVPRVKIYSRYGEFLGVVAGPQQLGIARSELGDPRDVHAKAVFDVATDARNRILVLDPKQRQVRVFEEIKGAPADAGERDQAP